MTKVKICGLQTMEDVDIVNRCNPDYAGFVFVSGSKRQISGESASQMKEALKPEIQAVGVFVNEDISIIMELISKGVIDCVQLHGDEDVDYILKLKSLVSCPVIKSVSVGGRLPDPLPDIADYILFDTAAPERGGSGKSFDWSLISQVKAPFFLAGGLHEKNVMKALSIAIPYCVDVSSGVETNGIKDEDKIRRFIRLVRKER